MLGISDRWYTIGYRGNPLKIKARCFKWGDLVTTQAFTLPGKGKQPAEEFPAGTIFRRNKWMGKKSEGASEWMRYRNLYDLWRAGRHIENRYDQDERVELDGFREKARAYVQVLIYLKNVKPEDKEKVVDEFVRAAEALSHKQAGRKIVAGARFMEALPAKPGEVFRDATGRKNPAAAAMIAGAGQGHLIERWEDAEAIVARTDLRTIEVFNAIQRHMLSYWNLWYAINPKVRHYHDPKMSELLYMPDLKGLNGPVRVSVRDATAEQLEDVRRLLIQQRDVFSAIVERPYYNNAAHTALDLEAASQLCDVDKKAALAAALEKVINGIRWAFAQHVLQMSYVTPLAMLLEHLERQKKILRNGSGDETPIVIKRSMAPHDFAQLEDAMQAFKERVLKCSDEGLDRQLKNVTLARVAMCQGLQDCDMWPQAKDHAADKISRAF